MSIRRLLAISICCAAALPPVRADLIVVTSSSGDTGGPDCTLRDALTAANSDLPSGGCPAGSGPDVIELPPSADIVLSEVDNAAAGDNGLPSVTSTITLVGAAATVRRAPGAPPLRLIHVAADGALTVEGLTLADGLWIGDADINGGGLYNAGHLILNSCTVTANAARCNPGCMSDVGDGGGIYNHVDATLTLSATTLTDNMADNDGGAVYNRGMVTHTGGTVTGNAAEVDGGGLHNTAEGTMNLYGATVTGNTANKGGALYNFGQMAIDDSALTGTVDNKGGALFNSGTAVLTGCTVSGCTAFIGAGLSGQFGSLTVIASTIMNNTATAGVGGGGGLSIEFGELIVRDTTVNGNDATADGGGLLNSGTTTLTNVTFSGNTAARGGGAYSWIDGTLDADHCTFAANGATTGAAALDGDGSATTVVSRSILSDSTVGSTCAAGGTFTDAGHNIVDDGTCLSAPTSTAADPQLGPLQNNGGPAATHEPAPRSPAVDAIRANACSLPADARGVPRPQGAGACDIGAVEYVEAIPTLGHAGLVAFAALLCGTGIHMLRRRPARPST